MKSLLSVLVGLVVMTSSGHAANGPIVTQASGLSAFGYYSALAWVYGWDTSFYRHSQAMSVRML